MLMSTVIDKSGFRVRESVVSTVGRVDRDAGVIYDVQVILPESRNGRAYTPDAISDTKRLTEGAKVYLDHITDDAPKSRRINERWGKLFNIRDDGTGGLKADLRYLKNHPATEQILEGIESLGDFGLSIDAVGKVRQENGKTVVYGITRVYSVDLVENPATTKNLFESEQMKKTIIEVLREHQSVSLAAGIAARIQEMDGMEDAAPMADMPVDMAAVETGTPEEQIDQAMRTAIVAILDMDLTPDEKVAKIKMLLMTAEEVAGASSGKTTPEPKADAAMTESLKQTVETLTADNKRLREEFDRLNAETSERLLRESCENLLRDAKREVLKVRVDALMAIKESARADLVATFPEIGSAATKPPFSTSRFLESDARTAEVKTYDDFKKRVVG